ncbi:MAG: 4Fe-4S dicluster domain-containing protein [Proteobacteria bacterium]|nr:4Fe-4S dicluster domain-containing protein [Pseudomonadota bacterium]MBU4575876.1 4Fe-4S dicluster domain-containing protein [Pseudomonadota bacterium]MBU4599220.1 4Fe-4S dicluster domain-containing protein [Pseudomonadota bacterium]MBV1717679.1 4Fe-4S dicluster domain-containing protein [Desulfarculus sp.]MBV1753936.1 4Fe-4S dicluster domain-containing protein [Desulfarculus sp.]
MGLFIAVEISEDRCVGIDDCGECVKVCPVRIFEGEHGIPSIVQGNEDECILCDQCLEGCAKDAISISKKY